MTDLIGRLLAWVDLLLNPGGAHRRASSRAVFSSVPASPRPAATRPILPSHRSPYGLPSVLDGAETVAVRPYVTAPWFPERQAA
ncbi:hypothetical protein ACIF9R_08770 [Streptomyces sp. NPDC086080]|uniref:hypothetical protein n=1 Tax=Streptomyces sp. NPDC086080 TaxID=3365748 RepID=UPI0037D8773B